jgi:hypothetical protein
MGSNDHRVLVREHLLSDPSFVRATFTAKQRVGAVQWIKVEVRPVLLKDQRHLQFVYFDDTKSITKNYLPDDARAPLEEVLDDEFPSVYIQLQDSALQLQITKKGKALVKHHKRAQPAPPTLDHDRQKARLLNVQSADPYLMALGVMSPDGKIKPSMQSKYVQINEFLRRVEDLGAFSSTRPDHLEIVDCGAGNAYLTFGVYHYFNNILNISTRVTGVEVDPGLVERNNERARALGWDRLTFVVSNILGYQPERPPDVVLALHACDTATDEALAQYVRWGARWLLSVPCCHHHVQRQLTEAEQPAAFRATLQHGILRERLGDVLTDSFRAALLATVGYEVEVMEFVESEHTAKNIMIRAAKRKTAPSPAATQRYAEMRQFWNVRPYLEDLLQESLAPTSA